MFYFIFGGNHHRPLSGTSAQQFFEPLVLLLWIWGTLDFPCIVTYLCTDPDHGFLTSVIWRELVKPCHRSQSGLWDCFTCPNFTLFYRQHCDIEIYVFHEKILTRNSILHFCTHSMGIIFSLMHPIYIYDQCHKFEVHSWSNLDIPI